MKATHIAMSQRDLDMRKTREGKEGKVEEFGRWIFAFADRYKQKMAKT